MRFPYSVAGAALPHSGDDLELGSWAMEDGSVFEKIGWHFLGSLISQLNKTSGPRILKKTKHNGARIKRIVLEANI